MLLMPTSLLKRTLAGLMVAVATKEAVDEVAERLRAGRLAVLNHLTSLGFADEMDRRWLESQLSPLA